MTGSARTTPAPPDAEERRRAKAIIAYPVEGLPPFDVDVLRDGARERDKSR